jgi:hypothetical protein
MIRIERGFSKNAKGLRAAFDERFADPRSTARGRFVWDYWHVPGQYTALRTPAQEFFPEASFQAFLDEILEYGRKTLGCVAISPPWLSAYVEGCEQELHADVPHGPFAFVYSLTHWSQRRFTGGETLLLKPRVLDYWGAFGDRLGEPVERTQMVEEVPAQFNQLLVFDPRIPHGVSQVRGVRDPRDSRLVIHGWFTEPRPYFEGPISVKAASRALEGLIEKMGPWVEAAGECHGILVLDIVISPEGKVLKVRKKVDTRVYLGQTSPQSDRMEEGSRERALLQIIRAYSFPRSSKGSSLLTLPLIFGK